MGVVMVGEGRLGGGTFTWRRDLFTGGSDFSSDPVERFGVDFGDSVAEAGGAGFDFGGNILSSSKPLSILFQTEPVKRVHVKSFSVCVHISLLS